MPGASCAACLPRRTRTPRLHGKMSTHGFIPPARLPMARKRLWNTSFDPSMTVVGMALETLNVCLALVLGKPYFSSLMAKTPPVVAERGVGRQVAASLFAQKRRVARLAALGLTQT